MLYYILCNITAIKKILSVQKKYIYSDRGIIEEGTPIDKSEKQHKKQSEGGLRTEAKRNMRKQRANTN